MRERWRPVVGHEGCYEVSDTGRVRSLPRTWRQKSRGGGTHQHTMVGKVLRPGAASSGHLSVVIGRGNSRLVHQLVLEAFVGPRAPGDECRHLNGDPADNRLVNLAWGSRSDNLRDKKWHGVTRKLSVADVRVIKRGLADGRCGRAIAAAFNVHESTVSAIKHGRFHTDV